MIRITIIACSILFSTSNLQADSWKRHVIDGSLEGADGVRLNDFDNDGLQDVVTGWEESGRVRLYLNPGPNESTEPWPYVTVGKGRSPEDAVAMDIDGDGDLDIVSCHEGKEQKILVHWFVGSSTSRKDLLAADNWKTAPFTQLDPQQWMFATEINLTGGQKAFIAGSKGKNATLTIFPRPATKPTDLSSWRPQVLRRVGWVMSLIAVDMDGDGDEDLVCSDRKGDKRGVFWLEQPNTNAALAKWPEHYVGATGNETLFVDATRNRILATTRNSCWLDFTCDTNGMWSLTTRPNPQNIPFGKAIKRLGANTLIMTANTGADRLKEPRPAIWIKQANQPWQPIGTATKAKYDRIECIDLDGDGDLDILTCEEKRNLGVIWYENPRQRTF